MRPERKRLRCALYTRKSSDEGLEQSFNSLDAQREACAAYVQSQGHEGPTGTLAPLLPSLPAGRLSQEDFVLRLHPDGSLHVGDRVSLELLALEPARLEAEEVEFEVIEESGVMGLQSQFGGYGLGGRMQATLTWAWNTAGLQPGEYNVKITIPSQDLTWQENFTLLPAEQVPPPEPQATWSVSETECCLVYHITGTAADRDLPELLDMVEEQADHASRLMGVELEDPIGVVFLPRILGHGGFAGEDISVSYLDRNYASDNSHVTRNEGIFTAGQLRIAKAPIHLTNINIIFGNGDNENVVFDKHFTAGSETRVIDLAGNKRVIRKVNLNYKSVPTQKGRAVVSLWGRH